MINPTRCVLMHATLLFCFLTLSFTQSLAQDFQRVYGTNLDNSFSKVIKDGSSYYVLGLHETSDGATMTGTITRLDGSGIHQWTLSSNFACIWNDAVLTPTGDLLVVGSTLPLDNSSVSLIGLVTTAGGGNFTWLRSYLEPGTNRNAFTRIVKNPVPQNAAFPYYILGTQSEPGVGSDDVVLLNINANGTFNWKKKFESSLDNDFARDLELFSVGQMILAGNNRNAGNIGTSVIYIVDNNGTMITGVQSISSTATFTDVATTDDGEIYATLTTLSNKAQLTKFSSDLALLWAGEFPQLTAASQVWEGSPGIAYITGRGNFSGSDRDAIVKLEDAGVVLDWLKYPNTGTSFSKGSSWLLPSGQIAFTDGRNIPGSFGQNDAFISLSDAELNTCNVAESVVSLQFFSPFPDSPILPLTFSQEIPFGTDLTIFQALNWEQAIVCSPLPCTVDFTYDVDCGVVSFAGQSSFPNPTSWEWTFAGGSPSTSNSQNPVVSFSECDSYKVCLTVTGGDPSTSCSVCHTVTIVDTIPPIALCLGIGVVLDANCEAVITPQLVDGGSSDDCLIQSMSISPNILTGCGLFPVTLTVTDWCGNIGTCMTLVQTIEDVPPMISCPPGVTIQSSSPDPCTSVVNNLQPTNVSDNCSTPTVTYIVSGATNASGQNNASGLIFNQGVSTITYTATDDCGNTTTCSLNVTVLCQPGGSENCGWTVATCYAVNPGDPVAVIYDTRLNSQAVPGADWGNGIPPVPATHPSGWTRDSIGNVFGIALDNNNKIYLAASDIYRYDNPSLFPAYGTGGPAGVYMSVGNPPFPTSAIVGTLNAPTLFPVTGNLLPNTGNAGGNGIGNIAYDYVHNQLFLTNLEDGRIYRITPGGNVLSAYDPFQLDNGQAGLAGILGERIWGIGVLNNRVYFARENLLTNKQIWSIPIDVVTGEFIATTTGGNLFTGTAQLEINNGPGSQKKYTDIAFSQNGLMLLAERGNPHDAGIYEFKFAAGWIPSGTNYSVGGNIVGKNSAGGVDYGYREQNGNPKANCDGLVWASGNCMDPGLVTGPWCKVYGIEGIFSGGNTFPANSTSDIYIDFDGLYTTSPKFQIGDVELFKCGCLGQSTSCDSIFVTSTPLNGPQDTCCFKYTIHNLKPNFIQQLQFRVYNGVSFSSVSALNGWCVHSFHSNEVTMWTPGCNPNLFPTGIADVVTICLSDYENVPNEPVYVDYYDQYGIRTCEEILNFECTAKPKCMKVTSTVDCGQDGQYLMNICVMSNPFIGFDVASFEINPPPGVIFTPNIFVPNPSPLLPGQMQCNFTTTVSGAVLDGQQICYSVTAHKGNILSVPPPADPSPSCTDTVMLACATMPMCVCDKLSSTIASVGLPGDSCCWSISLTNNYANNYFSGVQLEILTNGVIFGAINNPGNLWNLASSLTQATFMKQPPGTFIGASEILPTFCLAGITSSIQVPQIIEVKWLTAGNRVICTDTLRLFCEPTVISDCAVLIDPQITCDPGSPGIYNFSFQVLNNAGFTANQVVFTNVSPPAIFPDQFALNPPLPTGQVYASSISPQITGMLPGQQICFYLTLDDVVPGGNAIDHCTHSQQYCFTMPTCIDSCCTDSLVFTGLVNQGFTVVNQGCNVTVTAPQFDSCYWFGTPPYVVGGLPVSQVVTDPSGSWSFSFSSSGTYQICVTVFDGCQGKQMCTTVTVNCENGCHCGSFSDMAIRFERGPGTPLTCGGNPVFLECPPAGYNYTFTGKFLCQGTGCPANAPVDWQLIGPDNGTIASGTETGNPYLAISFPNFYFLQSGVYSLVLIGHCGSQSCPCVIKFLFDPPCIDVCPCTIQDSLDFSARVERGFAQIFQPNSCDVCFTPIALKDCETVEWHLNSTDEPVIGTSAGRETFCYAFPEAGDYNVVMNVSKKKDDGGNCDKKERTQNISPECAILPVCTNSVFDNPTFSEGAIAGGLNSGGHSNNWKASSGNPKLQEQQIGSLDGWTILLSGNLDTADILTRIEPICLEKNTGNLRTKIRSTKSNVSDRIFPGMIKVFLGRGWSFPPVSFKLNECNRIDCYELASVVLPAVDSSEWLELEIPYDLSDWDVFDSCGGVLVRPFIYVTNPLSNSQGGEETFSFVQLDNVCLGGTIVAVEEPIQNNDIRLFPNPTTGEIILQFKGSKPNAGVIQILDLYGRVMFTEKLFADKEKHSFTIASLPPGLYFVNVLDKGIPLWHDKVIKQ